MASVETTARYLLWLAAHEEEPEPICPMRLQKLAYYVQGWSLATRGRPFFPEHFEAWKYGPVSPALYATFKSYGGDPIPRSEGRETGLDESDTMFVRSIWDGYKQHSGVSLSKRSHREEPWLSARAGLPSDASSAQPIDQILMGKFFRRQAQERALPGLDPDSIEEGERSLAAGQVTELRDALRRLGYDIPG